MIDSIFWWIGAIASIACGVLVSLFLLFLAIDSVFRHFGVIWKLREYFWNRKQFEKWQSKQMDKKEAVK